MDALLVGIGAFFGGVSRYGIGRLFTRTDFPVATTLINLSGSFLLGVIAALWAKDHPARLLLGVGFLGGYTTFSTFSLEVLEQLKSNQLGAAFTNVFLQCVGGVILCGVGYSLATKLRGGG